MKIFIYVFLLLFTIIGRTQDLDSLVLLKVDSLIQVAYTLTGERNFEKAFEVNALAEKYSKEKFGESSRAYANAIHNHGRIHYYNQDYSNAEKWYLESKSIRENILGVEHDDYAQSLRNLALLYRVSEKLSKAESILIEAKSLRTKVSGVNHPEYAWILNQLAIVYGKTSMYEKAEELYIESKKIRENAFGKSHPEYAGSLINLAGVYKNIGQYEKSEPLYLEAKEVFEFSLKDSSHNYYGICLQNLASYYMDVGKHEKAEPLLIQALAITEKKVGKEHVNYSRILFKLGIYYSEIGNYDKSEKLYLEAKKILEKEMNTKHSLYGMIQNNLAGVYAQIGKRDKAELLCLEAIENKKNTVGEDHSAYAISLDVLGSIYKDLGQFEKAEALHIKAKIIKENVYGKNHPIYAWSLYNLSELYQKMGLYEKSFECYEETKSIQEKILGKDQLEYIKCLNGQAILSWRMGNYELADSLFTQMADHNPNSIKNAMLYLSENELNKYLQYFSGVQSQEFSFAQNNLKKLTTFPGICFNSSLFYKGFLLNSVNRTKRLAISNADARDQFNLLKSYGFRLSAEYSKPVKERMGVAILEEKANTLEKELVRTVAGYGEAIRQVKWEEVQQALPENAAAVEFVHYQYHNPDPTDSIMYAAIVLHPGQESPHFIPLFEEKSLDSLVSLHSNRRSDYVNDLYTLEERGASIIGKPQKSLYEMIWQPLEKEMADVKTIYFSPSGLLHRLNLGAIPVNEAETLADRYELVQLGSTRQLVVKTKREIANQTALLFGGIKYEADTTAMLAANANLMDETELASRSLSEFDFGNTDTLLRGGKWRYLNGTDVEVAVIRQIMKHAAVPVEIKKGYEATEEAFKLIGKNASSPRILHLATHGYFFPDPASASSQQSTVGSQETVFKISEHPMIRSGLILSGGNHAWKEGRPIKSGMEDGILTAYEISQMNLSNTELVVLSACETGLGDILGNEGVYGLQRAFKIAGAKYLIMSLWQVPDYQTQELMTSFYEKCLPAGQAGLQGKMSIPNAFRSAQKEMKDKYQNPYFWAGFVLVE